MYQQEDDTERGSRPRSDILPLTARYGPRGHQDSASPAIDDLYHWLRRWQRQSSSDDASSETAHETLPIAVIVLLVPIHCIILTRSWCQQYLRCYAWQNLNLQVVSGPVGCGKTAGVYGVAEELAFTVRELNSGICR